MINTHYTPETLENNTTIDTTLKCKVVVFNDEVHSFEEVTMQLIKATGCTFDESVELTLLIHKEGQAIVFTGQLMECLNVSSIIEEINLKTKIIF